MSLVVEYRVSGDPIKLSEVARAVPDASLEIERWRQLGDEVAWYVWVEAEDFGRVRDTMEGLPNAEDVTLLNDEGTVRLYSLRLDPIVDAPPLDLLEEGAITDGYVEPDGLHLTSRVSGRKVITGTWRYLRSHDIDVSVKRLTRASDDNGGGQMTDPQFDALMTAYEMGYFDEDERVTHEEIAEELGISRSSLSSRLRRAEREIVRKQLGE